MTTGGAVGAKHARSLQLDAQTPTQSASAAHSPRGPRALVLSSLFPSSTQPLNGLFIRERMFRAAKFVPIVVLAPQPWFPGQSLISRFVPHYRVPSPRYEVQDGIEIHRPRFLCVPALFKRFDGLFLALSVLTTARRLIREHRLNVIDAHFGYPDGRAGTLLGRWLGLPVMITLRGKEERLACSAVRRPLLRALRQADRLVSVSTALRAFAIANGVPAERVSVVGNGVDVAKFAPVDRKAAREALGIGHDEHVLISVGTLVERKGFHRIIELLPRLRERVPKLRYLVVGGAGAEGGMRERLEEQVRALGLHDVVSFLGPMTPDRLRHAYSAADVFTLATSYEGWANVFLEAMVCGLPVVTTDVGGNAEVVCRPELGRIIPFGDGSAMLDALEEALVQSWDRQAIMAHAAANGWGRRVDEVVLALRAVAEQGARGNGEHRAA